MRPRSLRIRLTLLFAAIVAGAIGVVYLAVVPQLEGQLRDQAVDSLAERAKPQVPPLAAGVMSDLPQPAVRARVERAAARAGARVTLLDVASGTQGQGLSVNVDSQPGADPPGEDLTFAEAAGRSGELASGTEPTQAGRIAEVAIPLLREGAPARVAVFTDDLGAVDANVALIQRRMLLWGMVALIVAAAAGALVARGVSLRAQRLERVARRVASGDFSSRIRDASPDELGRLAAAFADMQQQLAGLQSARTQFIATASHELRTPIFSIGGFLELLADEELDEETRRAFLQQVREQVARLTTLAGELLDLSRMDAGALELHPEPTDLGVLAREVGAELAPRATLHGSSVTVRVPEDPVEVDCDPERVAQVLRILLDNALVHTPDGTPITLGAERDGATAKLHVVDAGPGIHRDTMPQIFQPFFTSNADAQGAGLGLAIAHELAGRMGGELRAWSRPGTTRFSLELPA